MHTENLSHSLTFFLSYSNTISIITILTCLIVMVIFIVRLNGEQIISTFGWNIPQFAQRKAMIGIHNPFVLKLKNANEYSLNDDVTCLVTSCASCRVQGYWGVDITNAHWSMRQRNEKLIEECKDNVFFNGTYFKKSDPLILSHEEDYVLELKNPGLTSSDMGSVPRSKYPLVVVMSLESDDVPITDSTDNVIAMVSIIHLKDEDCPGDSHIVIQYVKTRRGKLLSLQQLYTISDSNSVEGHTSECIICTEAPVTRVILPCRHACACANCFVKLDRCPVCRGVLDSFFTIGEREETPTDEQTSNNIEHSNENPSLLDRFQDWNNRLNQWLGFT